MSGGVVRILAWTALGFDVLATVASAALDAGVALPRELETSIPNVFFLSIVSFGLLGALVVTRQPANRYGWLVSAIAFVHSIGYFAAGLAAYLLYRDPAPLPGGVGVAWFFVSSATVHYVPSVTFAFLLFPSGRLPARRWRPIAVLTPIALVGARRGR